MPTNSITPNHKAIERYHEELANYHVHYVTYEQANRAAFEHLLSTLASQVKWTLILEQPPPNRKIPDGTLRDEFNLPRGYWEAKDTHDDLETESRKKIAIGYSTTNAIFEDTSKAIIY